MDGWWTEIEAEIRAVVRLHATDRNLKSVARRSVLATRQNTGDTRAADAARADVRRC